jgi:hypothetical protein
MEAHGAPFLGQLSADTNERLQTRHDVPMRRRGRNPDGGFPATGA